MSRCLSQRVVSACCLCVVRLVVGVGWWRGLWPLVAWSVPGWWGVECRELAGQPLSTSITPVVSGWLSQGSWRSPLVVGSCVTCPFGKPRLGVPRALLLSTDIMPTGTFEHVDLPMPPVRSSSHRAKRSNADTRRFKNSLGPPPATAPSEF